MLRFNLSDLRKVMVLGTSLGVLLLPTSDYAGAANFTSEERGVLYEKNDSSSRVLPANETLDISDDIPRLFLPENSLPILLFPYGKNETYKLKAVQLNQIFEAKLSERLNQDLAKLVQLIKHMEDAIVSNNIVGAGAIVAEMKTTYPHLKYLKLYEANLMLLKGNKPEAIALLKAALADYPDNLEAKNLLQSLGASGK